MSFRPELEANGVKIPVRLGGPVNGVLYRTDATEAVRRNSPWEVFDCRLVLSLWDFAAILRKHEVVEARIFSAWRPPPKGYPTDSARRHQGALAVDIRAFKKENGEELVVLDDFDAHLGAEVCDSRHRGSEPRARELAEIACNARDAFIFNSILTPNYDERHRNHFHVELTPGVSWFMLH